MDAVFSLWGSYKADLPLINNYRLAFLLAKKHFGKAHLITNEQGEKDLSFFGWDSISTSLEGLPQNRKNVLSLGKIKAIGEAAERFKGFVHIDPDTFLWSKPTDALFFSDIFALCEDFFSQEFSAILPEGIKKYSETIDVKTSWMPLMSVCGGMDSEFLMEYSRTAIEIVCDPELESFWIGQTGPKYSRAIIALQWILAAMLTKRHKAMQFMFPNEKSPLAHYCVISGQDCEASGISRLGSEWATPKFSQAVAKRLSQNPPDLEPKKQTASIQDAVANFGNSMVAFAQDGFKGATKQQIDSRLAICKGCEFWDEGGFFGLGKCKKCGCSGAKLWLNSSKCPIEKW